MPANSTDAEIRVLHKSTQRAKQLRLLFTSIGFTAPKPVKVHEDNKAIVNTMKSNRITPYLRHVDLPLCYLHYEHRKGTFKPILILSKMQIANIGTKPESGPSLMRLPSIAIECAHTCNLSEDHLKELGKRCIISCYEHFKQKIEKETQTHD